MNNTYQKTLCIENVRICVEIYLIETRYTALYGIDCDDIHYDVLLICHAEILGKLKQYYS